MSYDENIYHCARIKWPGKGEVFVQVFADGSIYFEEDVHFTGRMEEEDVKEFLEHIARFGKIYFQAIQELEEAE
jgi:hypothetical protein